MTVGQKLGTMSAVRQNLAQQLDGLSDLELALVCELIEQIVACSDPDVVQTFLSWRADPRIDSILDLAASLGDDGRDQLLFAAEDLFSESQQARRVKTYSI